MRMNNKKAVLPLMAIVLLLGGVLAIAIAFGVVDTGAITGIFDVNGVYVSEMGRLECNKDQTPITTAKWLDQQTLFKCGDKQEVDECRISVENTRGTGFLSLTYCYSICDINGQNCAGRTCDGWSAWQEGSVDEINLQSGKSIKFETNTGKYIKVSNQFYAYRLYTIERGGKFITSSSDCNLANQNELQRNQFEYGDWDSLNKGDWRNYFIGWSKLYGAKTYPQGICLDQSLYSLDKIKLADGQTINVQGNKIRNVECCPHQDNNCGTDFEFKPISQTSEVECSFDYQCANAGNPFDNPFSSTSANIQKCISGTCEDRTISIECDSDAKCVQLKGDGFGCDLSFDNYGKCIKLGQVTDARCGDLVCTTGETIDNCPSDCTLNCPEGYKQISTTKYTGTFCLFGVGLCEKEVTTECRVSSVNYLLWLGIGLLIIALIVFRGQIIAVLRMVLKKVGI